MNIRFVLSNDGDEEEGLLSIYSEMWPGYQVGSLIWLERRNFSGNPRHFEAMPLRRFEVIQIEHHAGMDLTSDGRTSTNMHAEIYLRPSAQQPPAQAVTK